MRLHNRQVKAAFWEDPDLLRLPRDARTLFHGLWHLADDSGCLEHDVFAFKLYLFRSPLDTDITTDRLAEWTGILLEAGMLLPYEAGGKRCLYIVNFHKHQTLRSPAPPEVPLPSWVSWTPSPNSHRSGQYTVSEPYGHLTDTVRTDNKDRNEPYGHQPEPELEEEPEENSPPNGGTAPAPPILDGIPDAMKGPAAYLLQLTKRATPWTPDELRAWRELDRWHTAPSVTKQIDTAIGRFKRRGDDPATLTADYVQASMDKWCSRQDRKAEFSKRNSGGSAPADAGKAVDERMKRHAEFGRGPDNRPPAAAP